MRAMGVSALRLVPQRQDMVAVAKVFAELAAARIDGQEAAARLDAMQMDATFSNGFWLGEAGYRRIARAS
ncbi:MAG: Peptidase family U32 [Rhodobacteraceae bacterium HLUCCO07]|nr:MAG: Peptidase family U32 [Rhodobacteraceae bacterium HLUCCO07]